MTLRDALISPQFTAALVAGIFVASGWIFTHWLSVRRDKGLRAERVRDVQRALFAEIRAYLAALKRVNLAEYGAEMERRIKTEPGYFPVIPTERNDHIFNAIVSDIHVLPRQVIDPVVVYYSQLVAIRAIIADLRTLDLDRIGPDRAAAIYADYIGMKLTAISLGEEALVMMGGWLEGGRNRVTALLDDRNAAEAQRLRQSVPQIRAELDQMKARINTPASGRSFQ